MTGAPARQDMTVLIKAHRIVRVAQSARLKLPESTQVINGTDKYLIPGLWDMHAHTRLDRVTREIVFPLNIASGVTGLRVMAGDCIGEGGCATREPFAIQLKWKKEIALGKLIGPRLVISSTYIDGPHPLNLGSVVVKNADEARMAVRAAKRKGVDFIKIHNNLSRESYFALADEAGKVRIPFAGHVPWVVSAIEAANSGQKSEEHLFGVLESCSDHEKELLISRERLTTMAGDHFDEVRDLVQKQRDLLSYALNCNALFAALIKNHTWIVPTFNYWRVTAEFSFFDSPRVQDDSRLRYVPLTITKRWSELLNRALPKISQDEITLSRERFRERLAFVKRLHDAGVGILPGTDPDVIFTVPGFNLHDELRMFVDGGLTPMEALQTATRDSAEYLNMAESLGTIEPGKFADLVVLDANPLDDISNTTRIAGVVLNGRYFSPSELSKMMIAVQLAAGRN